MSGVFNTVPNLFGSKPSKVSLRLRYRAPIATLLSSQDFMGSENELAFTFTPSEGLIALRDDPTPELDKARNYRLSPEVNSQFLQPTSTNK